MREGCVVLARLPQVAGYEKNRPCLLLKEMPPFGDYLVCGISSQLHQGLESFDEFIYKIDPDFPETGLLVDSVIRLSFLAVLPKDRILGVIGSVSNTATALFVNDWQLICIPCDFHVIRGGNFELLDVQRTTRRRQSRRRGTASPKALRAF